MKVFSTIAALLAVVSADAEPGYYYKPVGVAHHPYGGSSYRGRTVYGYPSHGVRKLHYIHKREADAGRSYYHAMKMEHAPAKMEEAPAKMEHPRALAHHPHGGTSYVGRTVFGYPSKSVHKREADGEPHKGYRPVYSYGYKPAATVIAHKPATVIAHKPAAVIAHKPAAVIAHKPAARIVHKPAAVIAHKPAAVIAHKPAARIVHRPKAAPAYVAPSHGYSFGYKDHRRIA